MRRPSWIFLIGFAASFGVAGMAAAVLSPVPTRLYVEARTQMRQAMGLPKFWSRVPDASQAANREAVSCPVPEETIVVVTGGQSNAANSISLPYTAGPQVSVWFDGKCYPAKDPILGANGYSGSLWSLMGEELANTTGKHILLINGAIGGTQYADWNDPRSGYLEALLQRIETARKASFSPDIVIWHQGETDAEVEKDPQAIRAALTELSDSILDGIPGVPLYMFQASKCIGARRANGVEHVRNIQADLAHSDPRIFVGMNTDTLDNDFRWDTCHFNSRGRQSIVLEVVPQLTSLLEY